MLVGPLAVQAGPDGSVLHLLMRLSGSPAAIYAWSANDPGTFTPVGTISQLDLNGVYPGQRLAVGANDKIYRIGGGSGALDPNGVGQPSWGTRLTSEFDPITGIVTRKTDMPPIEGAYNGAALGGPDGNIYYLGGKFDRRLSYNAITDTWFQLPDIGLSATMYLKYPVGALASDGNIYIMNNNTGRMVRLRFGGPAPAPNTATTSEQTSTAVAGETVTSTAGTDNPDDADVTATLTNNGSTGGEASVYTAIYEENPISAAQGTVFDIGQTEVGGGDGGFFDIRVTGADSGDRLVVKVYYPISLDGSIYENNLSMSWYDGSRWRYTRSSVDFPMIRNKANNQDGTVSGGSLTYTFDSTSSPRITQLSGSVFTFTVDETPPEIISTVVGDLVTDDWYLSDVDVSFEVIELGSPDSLSISGCETVTVTDDTAGVGFTCTATSDGGTASETVSFRRDTIAPVFTTIPADQSVTSNDPAGAVVNFSADAIDGGDEGAASGLSDVVSIPAGGTIFSPGTTTVTHIATDVAGNATEAQHNVTVVLEIAIDVQTRQLNTGSQGVLPVVVMGKTNVDVTQIDVSSISLNQAGPAHSGHVEDVDEDGIDDLVVHFPVPDLVIVPAPVDGETVTLSLSGEIGEGIPISAEDTVVIKLANEKSNKGGKK